MRSAADPKTFVTVKCLRWSHLFTSAAHVASATRRGAITKTLATLNLSYISSSIAVSVDTVLP
jgi:hypothetical protein